MTKVTLPRTNQSGANEWSDVEANDNAIIEVVNGELTNENLKSNAEIARTKLATEARGVAGKWYTPTVIATEQTRENTAFGTLSTPDEITGIEVPTNGLLVITFSAQVKNSVANAGRVGVYISSNKMAEAGALFETAFNRVTTTVSGLDRALGESSVTTGRVLQPMQVGELAAGTYTVSVQYKASSGSITAKERALKVAVFGY